MDNRHSLLKIAKNRPVSVCYGQADLEDIVRVMNPLLVQARPGSGRAQGADFGQLLPGLGREALAGGEGPLEFLLAGRDTLTHLAAPGQIASVPLPDALEFTIAQAELAAEPGGGRPGIPHPQRSRSK